MPTDKSREEKAAKGQAEPRSGAQPKVLWDGSSMRSVYANVFNVAGGREEVIFLFGTNQAWDAGQQELKVQLTDRIVMSPFAAKRFSLLLGKVIQDYEKRYGILEIEGTRPETSTVQ